MATMIYNYMVRGLTLLCLLLNANEVVGLTQYSVALLSQGTGTQFTIILNNPSVAAAEVKLYGDGDTEIKSLTVGPGKSKTVENAYLVSYILEEESKISNKTIIVESNSSDLVAQVFMKLADHKEGYLGIPHTRLGKKHIVSTFCSLTGVCQFAVSTIEPENTTITLTFLPSVTDIIFCSRPEVYFRSARPKVLVLRQYEVVVFQSLHELSGTVVESDKRVSVISGAKNLSMEGTPFFLVEQMPPETYLGKKFVVRPLGTNGYGDLLRIASSTPNNVIEMTSYETFKITNTSNVVQRRLDGGLTTFITATYPILVTQFSGMTYASVVGDVVAPGMTVVPDVDQYVSRTLLSCPDEDNGTYYYGGKVVPGGSSVPYTDYLTGEADLVQDVGMTSAWFGVLKCGTTTLMPMGIQYNAADTGSPNLAMTFGDQIDDDGSVDEDYCTKNTKAEITVSSSGISSTHTENVEGAKLVRLRLQTCGIGLIKLKQAAPTGDSVIKKLIIELMNGIIHVYHCDPNCEHVTELDTSNYYSTSSDCTYTTAFFWLLFEENQTCIGSGLPTTQDCPANTTLTIATHDIANFVTMELSAVHVEASYNYDVERADCSAVVDDWRCEDLRSDCEYYDKASCTDPTYEPWMSTYCKLYCEKCTPDSFGNEFLMPFPDRMTFKAIVAVSTPSPNEVAVTQAGKLPQRIHTEGTDVVLFYFDSPDMRSPVYVRSQDDATVSVMYKYADVDNLLTYNVLPFDSLSTEYMAVTFCSTHACTCSLLAREATTTATVYTPKVVAGINNTEQHTLEYGTVKTVSATNGDDIVGTVFVADRPMYVYCGQIGSSEYAHYNQMVPTRSWGKTYITTALQQDNLNRPYEGKLRIVANVDNTLVTITGDFDAKFALYKRGDYADYDIDVSAVYTVEASDPIAVGLLLYDVTTNVNKFHLLPSVEQMATTHKIPVFGRSAIEKLDSEFVPISYELYSTSIDTSTTAIVVDINQVGYVHMHDPFPYETSQGSSTLAVVKDSASVWYTAQGQQLVKPFVETKEVCSISVGICGDKVDNDCDNLVDEDILIIGYGVTQLDVDIDGGFGEDFAYTEEGDVQIQSADPPCIEIQIQNNTGAQCRVVCDCPCAWLANLDRKKSIPVEQYLAEQANKSQELQSNLKVDTTGLSSTSQKKESASDKRQSAASIGYVGIALFVLIFGSVLILDIGSLVRDARVMGGNLREGFLKVRTVFRR